MKYKNPILSGFYPDPSVCRVGDTYYLVCSTMHYFPGVPIFESKDLLNWKQIGNCLTRESQVALSDVPSSGGVFAPTIRYHDGRFYMVTTNSTSQKNFYIWTDDIHGTWSEPIYIDQDGIDTSLYFENGKTYFLSNGTADNGTGGIVQCEIDIVTGEKLTPSQCIWQGSGGRYLEGPHLYKINGRYLLLAAEGGTEYGHMVTCAIGDSPYGPFKGAPDNPLLTNRNLGGYALQAVGHGDLIQDENGAWWLIHLGFRQIGQWDPFHHIGRETFLTPVTFRADGFFDAGENGTCRLEFETDRIRDGVSQEFRTLDTFQTTDRELEWLWLRHPVREHYRWEENKLCLTGTAVTLDQPLSPTFLAIRQRGFHAEIRCNLSIDCGEAGITCYMDQSHHYEIALIKDETGFSVIERLNIGDIKSVQNRIPVSAGNAVLKIYANNYCYTFSAETEHGEQTLGSAQTRYLSSEVACGFTGVVIGLYAQNPQGENHAEFENFSCQYL